MSAVQMLHDVVLLSGKLRMANDAEIHKRDGGAYP